MSRLTNAVCLVTAQILLASAAYSADRTDCCEDLEVRIAELEETVAKAGQRKVKLTVSGFLNEAIMFWMTGSSRTPIS